MTDVAPGMGQPNGRVPTPDYDGLPYGQEKQLTAAAGAANANADTTAAPTSDPLAGIRSFLEREAPGDLLADTEYPDEPGTAGLAIGPGPGPEVLGRVRVPRVTRLLDALAATEANPVLASLAEEAAARRI